MPDRPSGAVPLTVKAAVLIVATTLVLMASLPGSWAAPATAAGQACTSPVPGVIGCTVRFCPFTLPGFLRFLAPLIERFLGCVPVFN